MLEALFEPHAVRVHTALASSAFEVGLTRAERPPIATMSPDRAAEYATGRACARAALAEFSVGGSVPRLEGGAPQWPARAVGSISHTKGYCVAAAGLARDLAGVGIDVEEVARMGSAVERRILVDAERLRLFDLDEATRQQQLAITFAAKEAFYKAHHQVDARYLGFDVISVTVRGDGRIVIAPSSGDVAAKIIDRCEAAYVVADGRVTVGVTIATDATAVDG